MDNQQQPANQEEGQPNQKRRDCGIAMPISAFGDYSAAHWEDVLQILTEVIDEADFANVGLVSSSQEINMFQKNIVQNLYFNDIVIFDISGRNANVMFELGLRLAFDKPAIIIKDNVTDIVSDTAPIIHLPYPRSLRYDEIRKFREALKKAIIATHEKKVQDPTFSIYLKSFGAFISAVKLDATEVSGNAFILDEIRALRREFSTINSSANTLKGHTKRIGTLTDPPSQGIINWYNLLDSYMNEENKTQSSEIRLNPFLSWYRSKYSLAVSDEMIREVVGILDENIDRNTLMLKSKIFSPKQ